jgi:hypothetical protein
METILNEIEFLKFPAGKFPLYLPQVVWIPTRMWEAFLLLLHLFKSISDGSNCSAVDP